MPPTTRLALAITAIATLLIACPAIAQAPNRPQTPVPPFPYDEREVTFTTVAPDGITIAGTIVIPRELNPGVEALDADGRFPCVIFITGSGPQDRDETIADHKPFAVIADHLARRGIASLRCDDRGVGGTGGVLFDSSVQDFARDTIAGVRFCAQQDDIDPARIIIIGHSEGALIAPMAAAELGEEVAGVILLAGVGVPGKDLLAIQNAAMLSAGGVPRETIDAQLEMQGVLIDLIVQGAEPEEVNAHIAALARAQMGLPPDGEVPAQQAALIERVVEQQGAMVRATWFGSFLIEDPADWLSRLSCPVLAIGGSLDLQVPPAENMPLIEKAIAEGAGAQLTTIILEGHNHLLQGAQTGLPSEYATIEQSISPKALEAITNWLIKENRP